MKLYAENEHYKLYHGNMLDMLEVIEPCSIDSIVTDPPYELNFMNKGWDNSGVAFQKDTWRKCYEVLKPGGYLLAFGGSRTFHRIACAIEDAGFEIRDTIMYLYGSGFPKSMNIGLMIDKKNGVDNTTGNIKTDGKATNSGSGCYNNCNNGVDSSMKREYAERIAQNEWKGWGTALKPSYEPVIVARKPCEGSCIDNVLKYGVGGINIDECRVPLEENFEFKTTNRQARPDDTVFSSENSGFDATKNNVASASPLGRFPANTILTYDETDYDEVCGGMPDTESSGSLPNNEKSSCEYNGIYNFGSAKTPYFHKSGVHFDDEGSVARYFYCAKASKRDRDEGCCELNDGLLRRMRPDKDDNNPTGLNKEGRFAPVIRKNTHPTVKPTDLMQYLVRLVSPKGATILDPFNGSGSTGKAVMYENKDRNADYKYIGIELTEEYLPISKARIEYAINDNSIAEEQKKFIEEGQMSLF